MATISTQLRKFKEPTKDELTRSFFSIPPENEAPEQSEKGKEKGEDDHDCAPKGQMDINAVLSMGQEGVEDSYVCKGLYANIRADCASWLALRRMAVYTSSRRTCRSCLSIASLCALRSPYAPSDALSD